MRRGLPGISPNTAFERARVNIPGKVETVWNPIYDYQTKTAAATSVQRFFVDPNGNGGKTEADTNMTLSGQLPKGQAFVITSVQVELYPDLPIDFTNASAQSAFAQDVYAFYTTGFLNLKIGSKSYIQQGNLMKFAPVNRLAIDSSVSSNVASTVSSYVYATASGREFSVRELLLESSQDFSVELREMSAISADARLGVTLNGYLMRTAQ